MTEFQTPLAAPAGQLPTQRRRRLAIDLTIDLVLVAVATVISSVVVVGAVLAARLVLQGGSLSSLGSLEAGELLELMGVGGILAALLVQNAIFLGIPLLRVKLLRREPLSAIGLQAPRAARLVAYGVGIGALVLIANALIGSVFVALGVRQNQAAQYPLFAGDYLGQALFMLGAAVVVPIGEEILFRGYLFQTLRRIGEGRAWGLPAAYLISATVFGLAHALSATEGVLALIVPTLVMGLVLAWVVQRTDSVLPSIIAHAINNGVALLLLVTCVNNPGLCPNV